MKQTLSLKNLSAIFLSLFILIEYVFMSRIEAISPYAIYGAEIIWVALVIYFLRGLEWFKNFPSARGLAMSALVAFVGAGVHFMAHLMELTVPFDFQSIETIVFLLIIGPLLEEFLFHGALFRIFENFISKKWIIVVITALLFSYAHYRVVDQVPLDFQVFVKYQTIYTFVLGLICGLFRVRYGLVAAIMAHFFFNFGFWFAK